jgi:hypothetical protein
MKAKNGKQFLKVTLVQGRFSNEEESSIPIGKIQVIRGLDPTTAKTWPNSNLHSARSVVEAVGNNIFWCKESREELMKQMGEE